MGERAQIRPLALSHRTIRRRMTPLDRRDFLRTTGAFALGASGLSRLNVFEPLTPFADDRMAWWRDARFGMFVHWGLYSILAGEWGGRTDYAEWIRNNAKIPVGEYEKLLPRFNPTRFDADRLASLAAGAGAKYLVITTKHHDGFCLFDSKRTDWSVMHTPYKRDIMRMVADACRRHGVRPCWYHSIMDWHHPDYLPRRDWELGIASCGWSAIQSLCHLSPCTGRRAAHALWRHRRALVRRRMGEHVDARARRRARRQMPRAVAEPHHQQPRRAKTVERAQRETCARQRSATSAPPSRKFPTAEFPASTGNRA